MKNSRPQLENIGPIKKHVSKTQARHRANPNPIFDSLRAANSYQINISSIKLIDNPKNPTKQPVFRTRQALSSRSLSNKNRTNHQQKNDRRSVSSKAKRMFCARRHQSAHPHAAGNRQTRHRNPRRKKKPRENTAIEFGRKAPMLDTTKATLRGRRTERLGSRHTFSDYLHEPPKTQSTQKHFKTYFHPCSTLEGREYQIQTKKGPRKPSFLNPSSRMVI